MNLTAARIYALAAVFLISNPSCRSDCSSTLQCPHGVKHRQHRDTHIGKDRHPHGSDAESGQQQHEYLHTDGEPNVLLGNAQCATSNTDGKGYLRGLVVHKHNISGLDGGIAAETSHGDTYIGTSQDRGIVDAITDKGQL